MNATMKRRFAMILSLVLMLNLMPAGFAYAAADPVKARNQAAAELKQANAELKEASAKQAEAQANYDKEGIHCFVEEAYC